MGIGSSIVTRAGPSVTLRAATAGAAQTVYNFEVADYHTYFVGQGEVWVHNLCFQPKWTEQVYDGLHDGLPIDAAEHIWDRHRYASTHGEDVSRFASEYNTASKIKGIVTEALRVAKDGDVVTRADGSKRVVVDMGKNIGNRAAGLRNGGGQPTQKMVIYLDANNAVRTAHPY